MAKLSYTSLAACYDILNDEVDYDGFVAFTEACFARFAPSAPKKLLDLACGTGTVLLKLLQRGYRVTGIDLSPEMLAEAQRKAIEEGYAPLLLCQDMKEFEIYAGKRADDKAFDAVCCYLDSINYLTGSGDLLRCFSRVRTHLTEGGLFLFDVNTPYKFETVYGDNSYILEADGVFCAWQNDYRPESKKCRFDLSIFFEQQDGSYERANEVQYERCYPLRSVEKALDRAGFSLCGIYGDTDFSAVTEETERAFFVAQAK